MASAEALQWARDEARRLRGLPPHPNKGTAGAAVEFLRTVGGARSQFYLQAAEMVKDHAGWSAVRGVAELLEGWVSFVEAGFSPVSFETQVREAAATDLMEQVQVLLDDKGVHAAAPVVLAGAALEEFLRGMLVACPVTPKGKPGINSYAAALREAEMLTSQDVKDITAWAGLRNAAAHGEFDQVVRDRARLMADGINLFMRQKAPSPAVSST